MEYRKYQEGVIKSLLARPEKVVDVVEFIDGGDFEDVNYRMVYEAIIELHLENKGITLPEIALKIGEAGGSIDAGWLFDLETGVSEWIQTASPKTWAKLLKKESSKHKAIEALREGMKNIASGENDTLSEMDNVSTKLMDISLEATTNEEYDIKKSIENFKQETEEIKASGGKIAAISSAYPTIDYYTQGWGRTHLITVGARTGIGKSVFAINNAVAAMQQGLSVYFFSLEMTEREVISRMVASLSMIPILKIEKAEHLTEDEQIRHDEALNFIANSNIIIDTNSNVTVDYIKRAAIKQSHSEEGLDLVIVDYLQLIQATGRHRSRQEEVAEVSRSMKILAKELDIPVMVLVQLLREKRDEEDQVPKMYEIRESGAIAQDSNVVILIHRNKDKDAEVIDPKATFIIAKNRQGEDNKYISVRTRLESSLFIDDNPKGQDVLNVMKNALDDEYYEQTSEGLENQFSNDVVGAGFESEPGGQDMVYSNEAFDNTTEMDIWGEDTFEDNLDEVGNIFHEEGEGF